MLLRADALEHLLSVVRSAAEPQRNALDEEFIKREDFAAWLTEIGPPLPAFWFNDRIKSGWNATLCVPD